MPQRAKEKGYEVNGMPKPGSALVMDKCGNYGHTALVKEVKQDPNNPNKYTLTIIDANAADEANKANGGKGQDWSLIRERTIQYDLKTQKVVDPAFRQSQHVVFIGNKISDKD